MRTFAFKANKYGYFSRDDGVSLRNFNSWAAREEDGLEKEYKFRVRKTK